MPKFLRQPVRWMGAVVLMTLVSATAFGVPGTFRGRVHEGADIKPGWIYVEAINGNLRLVDVRKANIHYEDPEDGVAEPRQPQGRPQLVTGTEVRVTAEQDRQGHWHASEIEVLRETSRK